MSLCFRRFLHNSLYSLYFLIFPYIPVNLSIFPYNSYIYSCSLYFLILPYSPWYSLYFLIYNYRIIHFLIFHYNMYNCIFLYLCVTQTSWMDWYYSYSRVLFWSVPNRSFFFILNCVFINMFDGIFDIRKKN